MVRACKPTPGPSQCRSYGDPQAGRDSLPDLSPIDAAGRILHPVRLGDTLGCPHPPAWHGPRRAPGSDPRASLRRRSVPARWRGGRRRARLRALRAGAGGHAGAPRAEADRAEAGLLPGPRARGGAHPAAGTRAGGGDDRPAPRAAARHHARGRRLDRPAGDRCRATTPPAAALGRPGRGCRVRRQLRRRGVRGGGICLRL